VVCMYVCVICMCVVYVCVVCMSACVICMCVVCVLCMCVWCVCVCVWYVCVYFEGVNQVGPCQFPLSYKGLAGIHTGCPSSLERTAHSILRRVKLRPGVGGQLADSHTAC